MTSLLSSLLFKTKSYAFLAYGLILAAVYFFSKQSTKKECRIKTLEKEVKETKEVAHYVAKIQKQHVKIASEPTPDDDAIDEWLYKLSGRDKQP